MSEFVMINNRAKEELMKTLYEERRKHELAPQSAFVVYVYLVTLRNGKTKKTKPFIETIMSNTYLSKNTVNDSLRFLKKHGFIISIQQRGYDSPNIYYMPKEEMYSKIGITKEYAEMVGRDSREAWIEFYENFLTPFKKKQEEEEEIERQKIFEKVENKNDIGDEIPF